MVEATVPAMRTRASQNKRWNSPTRATSARIRNPGRSPEIIRSISVDESSMRHAIPRSMPIERMIRWNRSKFRRRSQ